MKRILAVVMAMIIALCAVGFAGANAEGWYDTPRTMYVYTENLKPLNVRSEPRVTDGSLIGSLEYGAKVTVLGDVVANGEWVIIEVTKE